MCTNIIRFYATLKTNKNRNQISDRVAAVVVAADRQPVEWCQTAEVWHRARVCGGFYNGSTWRSFNDTLRLPVVPFSICIQTRHNRMYPTSLNLNKIPFLIFIRIASSARQCTGTRMRYFHSTQRTHRNGFLPFDYSKWAISVFLYTPASQAHTRSLRWRHTFALHVLRRHRHERAMILLFLLLSPRCWAMHARGREEKEKHKRNSKTRKAPPSYDSVGEMGEFYNRK